jgi:hypothetical protein
LKNACLSAGKAPEVLEVIRFLDRVSGDEGWAEGLAARVLSGNSGLHRPPDGADCFADRFPYLRGRNRAPAQLVADLRRDLFHGAGGLSLHLILISRSCSRRLRPTKTLMP